MMGMDYDSLDQMLYKEPTCTGSVYTKLNMKAFESGMKHKIDNMLSLCVTLVRNDLTLL